MDHSRIIMSISLFLLLHATILAGLRTQATTKNIPKIIENAPGIAWTQIV
jgi:hypothetical protein